jgi:hypothetical protein
VGVGIGEEGANGLLVPTKSRVLPVIVLVMALDCFPHRQSEDEDDHEHDQEVSRVLIVLVVVVVLDRGSILAKAFPPREEA